MTIDVQEAVITDHVLADTGPPGGPAHPLWLLLIAMRGMGITVDELCALAGQREQDLLLFGNCRLEATGELVVGASYEVAAAITSAERKTSRGGNALDVVVVSTDISAAGQASVGRVDNTFIFKRGR